MPVDALCEQGLCNRDLGAQMGLWAGIPSCAAAPTSPFNPRGQAQRVAVCSFITGTGRHPGACRAEPLDSTWGPCGCVWQGYSQAQPWVILTDTPVAQTVPALYTCRNWIEQGFRDLKTVGDPCMVGEGSSPWLVLAIATLLAVARLRRLLLRGDLWACVLLRPMPGPDFRTQSNCVGCQVSRAGDWSSIQGFWALIIALRMVSSLRMAAMRATFLGLPTAHRCR